MTEADACHDNHDCRCGHEHNHECGCGHEHNHDCGCGHEHNHDCGCGHEHNHECECGHEHNHDCGCGHHHVQPSAAAKAAATPAFGTQPKDKGVSLGADLEQEIAEAMMTRYKRFLNPNEKFEVKTEVCHQFGLVSAHLTSTDRTTNVEAEVCIECEANDLDNPIEAYQVALDVLDTVLLEYFDSDRISHYLPIWQCYEVDDHTANVRLDHANLALDDEASAFLKAHGFTDGGLEIEPDEDYEMSSSDDDSEEDSNSDSDEDETL